MSLALVSELVSLVARADDGQQSDQTLVMQAWHYVPNKFASYVFGILSALLACISMINIVRYRNWWGLILPIGSLGFAGGFAARVLLTNHQDSVGIMIVEQILIICSPAAFLAFNYIVYGRLVTACLGKEYSLINPRRVSTFFVISDFATFVIQASGASMGSGDDVSQKVRDLGSKLFQIGLALQLVSYVIFVALVIVTHTRAIKTEPEKAQRLKRFMIVLYISSSLIVIRCIFRVVEGVTGFDGYLFTHEAPFYIFDAVPLMIAMWIYNLPFINYWPGAVFRSFSQIYSEETHSMTNYYTQASTT